MLLQLEKRTST